MDSVGVETMQTQAAPIMSSPSSLFFHDSGQLPGESNWSFGNTDWAAGKPFDSKMDPSNWMAGSEKAASLSSVPWARTTEGSRLTRNLSGLAPSQQIRIDGLSSNLGNDDSSLFSSSLPNLFQTTLKLSDAEEAVKNMHGMLSQTNREEELFNSLEELESHTIGNLLPDDEEELLAGIVDDYDCVVPSNNEDSEEFDLFSSGGGMEMDMQDGFGAFMNGYKTPDILAFQQVSNGAASVAGEHPYGEHPSRTLFVRNINSNVEDSELRVLFEQYGDIRTLYTACKHRGFVMISYYDIRSARSAMRALQNKPLRRRKLDIHFSIPKDNPSDKDVNQGTLVVFNLDASVSNDDLRQIFGAYGEVKEIRETPHKRHHKFIEFYDVRAAEAALRALNRSDIAGKRIKLEPSRPGGARRSLMQQLTQEPEEDNRSFTHQSTTWASSPPGHPSQWGSYNNHPENGAVLGVHPGAFPKVTKALNGAVGSLAPHSPPVRNGVIGSHIGQVKHAGPHSSLGMQQFPSHPQSLPEYSSGIMTSVNPFGPGSLLSGGSSAYRTEGLEGSHFQRTLSETSSYGHVATVRGVNLNGHVHSNSSSNGSLSSQQFLWGTPNPYTGQSGQNSSSLMWPPSSLQPYDNGHPHAFSGTHGLYNAVLGGHVGSAPSGEHSIIDRCHGYLGESSDLSSIIRPPPGGAIGMGANGIAHSMNGDGFGIGLGRNGSLDQGSSSPNLGMLSPHHRSRLFSTLSNPFLDFNDRGRSRRADNTISQMENKKQFQLDLERILNGEDTRTTLMIKNIPNKYTSKMLLAAIDEQNRGTYDFIYLPIDFKNKCNVGYAFINMISPLSIIPFYQAFHGKKWEKFNSEKVASLAYARIQGKAALIAHFQNSSLMNEDKRCRPILFHSDGPNAGDQEPFPVSMTVRTRPGKERSSSSSNGSQQGSPTASSTKDEPFAGDAIVGSPVTVDKPSLGEDRD